MAGATRRAFGLRLLSALGAAAAASACSPLPPRPQQEPPAASGLRLLGEYVLPYRLRADGTTVGGLSGLDFDPESGRWWAICDDRSALQDARFYELSLALSAQGLSAVQVLRAHTLRDAQGRPYPSALSALLSPGEVPDPEALRWLPRRGTLLWTSEGDRRRRLPPALREMDLSGRLLRDFALPAHFLELGDPSRGPRNNLCFEGLAVSPDGRHAWVAMEGPLLQDGPLPRPGQAGGPCRLTRFDLATGQADHQIAYQPDPVPLAPWPGGGLGGENGISEILMLDAHQLLVLERAYVPGRGVSLCLYRMDTREASPTLTEDTLRAGAYRAAPKHLVADFARLGLTRVDNTEGMCWGPRLPNGHRTLVCVSDDNFNPLQITQFLAFEFLGGE